MNPYSLHIKHNIKIARKKLLRSVCFRILFLTLLVVQTINVFAQKERHVIDSLWHQLQIAKADTTRANIYWKLADNYCERNIDSALQIATEGYKLAEKTNSAEHKGKLNLVFAKCYKQKNEYLTALSYYKKALINFKDLPENILDKKKYIGHAYDGIGVIYHSVLNNYDSATIFHNLALKILQEANDTSGVTDEYTELANISFDKGEYKNAIAYHYQALKMLQQKKDTLGIANSSLNIGNVCVIQGDYAKARTYLMDALHEYESIKKPKPEQNLPNSMGNCLFSIAELYKPQKQYDSAAFYYEKALALYQDRNFIGGISASYGGIAEANVGLHNYQKGLEFYFKALKMLQELDIKSNICITLGGIGEAYLSVYKDTTGAVKTGNLVMPSKAMNLSKAIEYLSQALKMSKELDDKESIKEVSQYLSEAYKAKGDYKNAYENYLLFSAAKDTLADQDTKKQLRIQETEAHKEILDKQTKLDELQIQKNKNETIFLYIGLVVMLFVIGLVVRSNMKQNKSNKIITREKKRSDELLLNILPAEVAEELKDKGSAEAKYFQEVTVFFSDFVGFTKVAERMTPQQLVNELDACFKGFDHIMTKYNIEKIKTVGDAYLAVSGLPMTDPNHAEKIIRAAIEIREFQIERKKQLGDMTFEVRIGAHSGSVVAGIVGVKKFAYDIWGDTVNTAARMEQNSMPGKINISEVTYQIVKDKFACEFRGKIQAKNKGELSMYFVDNSLTEDA